MIVADDDSTDETPQIAAVRGCRVEHVSKRLIATRFTAGKIGIPPALVLNSTWKFDKHGDWHMIPDVLRGAFYLLFARRKLKEYAAHN